VLEEAMLNANIPYKIYGGMRFFERTEIKDALAYLRLMAHRHDDAGFERVVNTPTRGIGERTLQIVRNHARNQEISLWQAAVEHTIGDQLTARARNSLQGFIELIERMSASSKNKILSEQIDIAIKQSSLKSHYEKEGSEKARGRIENLEELVNAGRQFAPEEGELNILDEFITHAALEAGEGQADEWEDCVQMMTLHSAKGLEFPQVFLSGMEEELFPHKMSANDPDKLEEERRLCYVGITRARQKLYMTYAESRRLYGQEHYPKISRFIREIPDELLEEVRIRSTVSYPVTRHNSNRPNYKKQMSDNLKASYAAESGTGLNPGQQVRHSKFGDGTILMVEGNGAQARIQIHFTEFGSKWLVAGYAKLEPI
jgi:DNA helicase-2/ATP-dependent DNA helicase PcrA